MSAEETQQRNFDDRLRENARRNCMTTKETEERRSEDRLRTVARRNNMTAEETEEQRSDDQLRTLQYICQLFEFGAKYTTSPGRSCRFLMKNRSSSKNTSLETKK
ncbi:hypothetical protein AVEN_159375-1 [Araneus ventricosus]|uniref:Uncharacterized protein n=1 Tax=Araneus ventricosus TaxID=182803 RepID=A0A4Y2A1B7_ARAVE|nr:hypothetical protein AVEN_159375-1 [Araneus ventricosus]